MVEAVAENYFSFQNNGDIVALAFVQSVAGEWDGFWVLCGNYGIGLVAEME